MEDYINLVYSITVFIMGLLFGSFFTLATYRIPRHQDIIKTRSYCPNCKHKLGFFDCFPVLSYVSTIGRCKYCKKPISIRYPLIELATGFTFLITYLIFGFTWRTLVLIICYIYLFLVIGVDIMKKKMTKEEIEEIEKNKKNSKKGALNIDLIIAVVIFIIFFISTIFVRRNYMSTLIFYENKAQAMNICINNLNNARNTSLSTITNSSGTQVVDGVTYSYNINVYPYISEETNQIANAKVIESTVSFVFENNVERISLKSIKVEE